MPVPRRMLHVANVGDSRAVLWYRRTSSLCVCVCVFVREREYVYVCECMCTHMYVGAQNREWWGTLSPMHFV
jgi:hypothetical protein